MPFLRVTSGQYFGREYLLGDSCVLGRSKECPFSDIFGDDETISRRHTDIIRHADRFQISDQSTRGTLLNDQPLAAPTWLKYGDRIGVCSLQFEFCRGRPSEQGHSSRQTHFFSDGEGKTWIQSELPTDNLTIVQSPQASTRLAAILEMIRSLDSSDSLPEIYDNMLAAILEIFPQVERGFIGICDDDRQRPVPVAVKHRDGVPKEKVGVSLTLAKHVLTSRNAVLCNDTRVDIELQESESIPAYQIRSVMCVPILEHAEKAVGLIQVDSLAANRFQRADLEMLASLAPQATLAYKFGKMHQEAIKREARDAELRIAQRIQSDYLPHATPQVEGYRFFHFYRPARELGGDYYDYFPLADGRLAIIQADVAGKGVGAALMVSRLCAEFSHLLDGEANMASAVTRLNERLCKQANTQIVTLASFVLDAKRNELAYMCCGHPFPLMRRNGEVKQLTDAHHPLLGAISDHIYTEQTLLLEPGDCLAVYTDGFNEAMNSEGDMLNDQPILDSVRAAGSNVSEIGDAVIQTVQTFVKAGQQSDDMCLVCFERAE